MGAVTGLTPADRRPRRKEQAQQCRAQGQQPPEQGQLHGIGLRQRFVHYSHTADPTNIIGRGVFTKPLAPSPV